jgi:hypothetical protein
MLLDSSLGAFLLSFSFSCVGTKLSHALKKPCRICFTRDPRAEKISNTYMFIYILVVLHFDSCVEDRIQSDL